MSDTRKESLMEMFRSEGYRVSRIDDLMRWLQAEKDKGYTWVALDGTLQLGDGAVLWSNKPQM